MVLFCLPCLLWAQERFSVVTYYPTPHGSFKELQVKRQSIGAVAMPSDNSLNIQGRVGVGRILDQSQYLSQLAVEGGISVRIMNGTGVYGKVTGSGLANNCRGVSGEALGSGGTGIAGIATGDAWSGYFDGNTFMSRVKVDTSHPYTNDLTDAFPLDIKGLAYIDGSLALSGPGGIRITNNMSVSGNLLVNTNIRLARVNRKEWLGPYYDKDKCQSCWGRRQDWAAICDNGDGTQGVVVGLRQYRRGDNTYAIMICSGSP